MEGRRLYIKVTPFLVALVLYMLVGTSSADTYYVTPSGNIPCPEEGMPCFTLSQYAIKPSNFFASNITLFVLPGNHILDSEFLIRNTTFLSVVSNTTSHSDTLITCYHSAKLTFENIDVVNMKGLVLLGCVNSEITFVEELTLEDCSFQGQGHNGTGLELNEVSTASITKSTFSSNTGKEALVSDLGRLQIGGAMIVKKTRLDITDSVFNDNTANVFGGALYTNLSDVTIHSCSFNNNTVTGDGGSGGAVFAWYSYSFSILNCEFTNNQVTGIVGSGGAVFAVSSLIIHIYNCVFTNNTATSDGGAVSATIGRFITIYNSEFNNNTVTEDQGQGGAVYTDSCSITIDSSTLDSNTVTGDSAWGGAVFVVSSSFIIHNSKLNGNAVTGNGGSGGAVYAESSSITIDNSTFANNTVTDNGGAVSVLSSPLFAIVSSEFNNNNVNGELGRGGAVYTEAVPITIESSIFYNNNVIGGGGALFAWFSSSAITILHSVFKNNSVNGELGHGGAVLLHTQSGPITIDNCTFYNNTVTGDRGRGGAVYANSSPDPETSTLNSTNGTGNNPLWDRVVSVESDPITINNSILNNNAVNGDGGLGGAVYTESSTINIGNSTLNGNGVIMTSSFAIGGGAVYAESCRITVDDSTFNNNIVSGNEGGGGAVLCYSSPAITIHNSKFKNNIVIGVQDGGGGALSSYTGASIILHSSEFINNIVTGDGSSGGAVHAESSSITIDNSTFISNTVTGDNSWGGAVTVFTAPITINDSEFNNNTVTGYRAYGGAVAAFRGITIHNGVFKSNSVSDRGSALYLTSGTLNSTGCLEFQNNTAKTGVLYAIESTLYFSGNTTISNNHGSLFVYSSNVTFSGYTNILNNSNNISQEGGAVTGFQSEIIFTGTADLMYNMAVKGGAILATQSKLYTYGQFTVSHNTASVSGGGIYAYQSELNFKGNVAINGNFASDRGGGIHTISSTTRLADTSKTYFVGNHAEEWGGMCLERSAKIYLLITDPQFCYSDGCILRPSKTALHLYNNTADYGGAMYIADDTNSGTCYATPFSDETTITSECFIQSLGLYQLDTDTVTPNYLHIINTDFSNNSATEAGDVLYGGLLDRCGVNPFSEMFQVYANLTPSSLSGTSYIVKVTDLKIQDFNSTVVISSGPVRVCFCSNNQPDCSYHLQPTSVKKGETFTVSLVAVDHINNTISNSTVNAFVSIEAKLGEGQSIQQTSEDGSCTDLTYSILSPYNCEKLHLYADGPCMSAGISTANLTVNIKPCPIGFKDTILRCECEPILYDEYITNCSIDSESVQRKDNAWFSYVSGNNTDHQGYVLHRYCPFDYCHPPSENVSINLNVDNGADDLCAFNRSGKLCGTCKEGLSLSLGSSRCRPCSHDWLTLLIVFAIAGVLLVAFLLELNFTVAVGTFNGLIFYANIFAANRAIFFPSDETKFLTIFIAWLNLDFGFETCFFDGMDGYAKTWLQLAFPLYVISLVAAIIIICDYSSTFTALFTGKNPIATLATLILLSYTKLLRTIIASLSFTTLQYSDGSHELVWLVDANIPFLSGKHIPLVIIAIVIVIVSVMYTFLLFAWQWLVHCPNKGPLRWIIGNTKVIAFMDAYQNPYNKDYRYWIGLLLLIRVLLYLVSALNVFGDPRINLLSITLAIVILLFFQNSVEYKHKVHMHKTWLTYIFENISLLNLIGLTSVTYFVTKEKTSQNVIAYASTGIAFATFLTIFLYHIYKFVLEKRLQKMATKVLHKLHGPQMQVPVEISTPISSDEQPVSETELDACPEPKDTCTAVEMTTVDEDVDLVPCNESDTSCFNHSNLNPSGCPHQALFNDQPLVTTENEVTAVEMELPNLTSHDKPFGGGSNHLIMKTSPSYVPRNPGPHMTMIPSSEKALVEIELPLLAAGVTETGPVDDDDDVETLWEDETTPLLLQD